MSLLTDEEQDKCMPTEGQLKAYLAEPDDAVAAALSLKDKRLVAKFILSGRNIADASQTVTLKAVAEWGDGECNHDKNVFPVHRRNCHRCRAEALEANRIGKMPGGGIMELLIETDNTDPTVRAGLYYAKPIDVSELRRFIVKLILSHRFHSGLDYSEEIGESTATNVAEAIVGYMKETSQ